MKRRILVLLLSFVVIYLFNFSIPRMMPGDPFSYTSADASENADTEMSQEQKEYMRAYYGMDKPLFTQLKDTIKANLRGDFGQSIHYKRAAADVIRERLPWTLFLMGATLLLSLVCGVFLALWSIRRRRADRVIFGICSVVTEIPSYLIGILLLFLVAAKVKWIPLSGAVTAFAVYDSTWEWLQDVLVHAMLPILAMCLFTIPKFYFTARASFLSIHKKPYLLAAKAKGLKERRIRWRYIFVNGITPIVARLFLCVGTTVGGTMLIENVFSYPGLGTIMKESVKYRDYIMIQDIFLLSTVIVLLSLFVADLLSGLVDKEER